MLSKNVAVLFVVCALCIALGATSLHAGEGKRESLEKQLSGQSYGAAGCGLGSVIFGDKHGIVQVIAATTNATAYNQTFGISSGTSNCDTSEGKKSASLGVYVEANRIALAHDMARGNGETLAGLSKVIGCQDSSKLGGVLQKNYTEIFPNASVDSKTVSQSILKTVRQDHSLATTCQG